MAGAVEVGFEPTEPVKAHALSRRARSAASVLHLGQYRRRLQGLDAAPPGPEELLDHRRAVLGEDAGGQAALVVEAGGLGGVVLRIGCPRLLRRAPRHPPDSPPPRLGTHAPRARVAARRQ